MAASPSVEGRHPSPMRYHTKVAVALTTAVLAMVLMGVVATRSISRARDEVLLIDHTQGVNDSLRRARLAARGGFVAAVVALLLAGLQVARELRRRRVAEAAASAAHEDVERRIHERTRDQAAALESLEIREAEFRALTELSPVFLLRTDARGGLDFVSHGFCEFSGLTSEHSLGRGWTEAVVAADRAPLMSAWDAAIQTGRALDTECRLSSADGRTRWFRIRLAPRVAGAGGAIRSWVGAVADIHEMKEALATRSVALGRAEQSQREAEAANQLKDDFLATASHELRTPLNAIVGWAHVLKLPAVGSDERRRAVEAIERNAKVQTRLIEELLDVSTMVQGRMNLVMSAVDLRQVVSDGLETTRPAALARSISLELHLSDEPVVIDADPNRLQQVASNLVSNALKFTAKGGLVRVTVDRIGSRARLRVEDNGEGIDPAFLPHVFDAFRQGATTTMRSGLGLGLAIVRSIVELHGGAISAQSDGAGRGATFTVTVPMPLVQVPQIPPVSRSRAPRLLGVKIIVAEDDDDSGAALGAVLRFRGCQVRIARTAAECLRLLAEWRPDLLICDIGLPDEDGYSLLAKARAIHGCAAVPAIALTAYTGQDDRVRALAAGFSAHVTKPFDPDVLVREIASALVLS